MNQKISIGLITVMVLIIAGTAGLFFWIGKKQPQSPIQRKSEAQSVTTSKEQSCVASGGTVQTSMCCGAVGDFPNLCLWGACGCGSGGGSHQVKTCFCEEDKCFNGDTCVNRHKQTSK